MSSSYLQPVAIQPENDQLIISSQLPSGGLEGWEEDDPCRYANQSCKGKMFGALKRCRRKREKSQALCKAHERKLAEKKKIEQEKQQLMTALQHNVTDTAAKQETASTAMIAGAAVGGVAILGAAIMFIAKKKKSKSQ
ncbi:hypothetical protein CK503_08455 [Aliifodinibius salipaludis]|jgi:hypothetical protein|uniref:Uncharacterized protein n=1 Tax=Fodinibius salipaludis TaxID=2032627 RepID=A0A2A2GB71_9BACT|nr:hypothetical protein [Aliifodinibius salipaludis]PAU94234.1 hypothetical protein CK503_08455 [Aliifodinibius salipaludis]